MAKERGKNFALELDSFRDHEFKTPRKDADAAFRNWLRRDFGGKAPGLLQHEATLAELDQALLDRAKKGEFGQRARERARAGTLDLEKLKSWLHEKNQRSLQETPLVRGGSC